MVISLSPEVVLNIFGCEPSAEVVFIKEPMTRFRLPSGEIVDLRRWHLSLVAGVSKDRRFVVVYSAEVYESAGV